MKNLVLFYIPLILSWPCAAQVHFKDAVHLVTPSGELAHAVLADFDGDGDNDVISANFGSDGAGMYLYTNDGYGTFETTTMDETNSGYRNKAADLDGDGDLDLISINYNQLFWYRNLGGMQFSAPIEIDLSISDGRALEVADMDGDGDLDVLFGEGFENRFGARLNLGNGEFSAKVYINTTSTDVDDITAADLDADGDMDLVVSCLNEEDVAWFENLGSTSFGPQQILTTSMIGNTAVETADLDGDGDLDIISSAFGSDELSWFKNQGSGNFSSKIVLSLTIDGAYDVQAGDLDGDGDIDLVCPASVSHRVYYLFNNGNGIFTQQTLPEVTLYPQTAIIGQVNDDLVPDIISVSRSDNKLLWFDGAISGYDSSHYIAQVASFSFRSLPVDVDNDGDIDVIGASSGDSKLALYKNNGNGTFTPQEIIDGKTEGLNDFEAADIDGDGLLDILANFSSSKKLVGYKNLGNGAYSSAIVLGSGFSFNTGCGLSDLDGDGDLDALVADRNGYESSYFLNNGNGTFSPRTSLDTSINGPKDLLSADLDNDGDEDIIILSEYDQRVMWMRNNGNMDFSIPMVAIAGTAGIRDVTLMDLDGDGYLDMFAASYYAERIYYALNTGNGFGPREETFFKTYGATSINAGDIDNDGDLDLICSLSNENKIRWIEVEDGAIIGKRLVKDVYERPQYADVADFDGDGFLDVVASYLHTVAIFENKLQGCSVADQAPVGLTKAQPSQDGMQDRIQLKWYKDLPQIKFTAAENTAVDIEFWPIRDLITDEPILDGAHTLLEKKVRPGIDFYRWGLLYARSDIDPNMRYAWRVRVYCDAGEGDVSPWSELNTFNTPDFDPETGIYSVPPFAKEMLVESENGFQVSLLQNPIQDELSVGLTTKGNKNQVLSYEIHTPDGQLVSRGLLFDAITHIDAGLLSHGVYHFTVRNDADFQSLIFIKE